MRRGQSRAAHGRARRAFARRIDQVFVEAAVVPEVGPEQVRDLELRHQAVRGGVLPRALDQQRAALEADHLRAARGDRQREVADAAEEIRDALARLRIEQPQRARNEHAVHRRVHLREIGGLERDLQAEFGQRVVEAASPRPDGTARRCPALPAAARRWTRFASANARSSAWSSAVNGSRWRNRSTVAASPTAISTCGTRSRIDSLPISARRGTIRAEMRGGRTSQLLHVRHVGGFALAETDQRAALAFDVAHRQARAVPVAPLRAVDRRQHRAGLPPCRCAPGCPPASAAWRPPACARPRAAWRSRRRCRIAGTAARAARPKPAGPR